MVGALVQALSRCGLSSIRLPRGATHGHNRSDPPGGKPDVRRSGLRSVRSVAPCLLALLLGGCITEGPAPPRVDLPEPGAPAGTRAAQPGAASVANPGGAPADAAGVRVHAAPSSALPLPSAEPGTASTYPAGGAASGLPLPEAAPSSEGFSIDAQHAPATSSNSAVNTLLAQADSARRGGDLEAAIASAERALRIAPADPAVYYELATLRLARGESDAAVQLAQKGLSHNPDPALRQRLADLLTRARSG